MYREMYVLDTDAVEWHSVGVCGGVSDGACLTVLLCFACEQCRFAWDKEVSVRKSGTAISHACRLIMT